MVGKNRAHSREAGSNRSAFSPSLRVGAGIVLASWTRPLTLVPADRVAIPATVLAIPSSARRPCLPGYRGHQVVMSDLDLRAYFARIGYSGCADPDA